MASQMHQDSELQHSFAPGEIGFDYLPLERTPREAPPVPTSPVSPIPVFSLESDEPLPPPETLPVVGPSVSAPPPAPTRPAPRIGKVGRSTPSRAAGEIWLEGEVILVGCPDCRAPMSVRIWLMMAECWNCGTTIELSEEQEREVMRLLEEQRRKNVEPPKPVAPAVAPVAAPVPPAPQPAPVAPQPAAPSPSPAPAEVQAAPPEPPPAPPAQTLPPPPPPPTAVEPAARVAPAVAAPTRFKGAPPSPPPPQSPAARAAAGPTRRPARRVIQRRDSWLKSLLNDTPAWLISMLVHMVALTLLALLTLPYEPDEGPYILLSASIASEPTRGEANFRTVDLPEAKFDMPVPNQGDLEDPAKLKALVAANQDARDLRLTDDQISNLPSVEVLKERLGRADGVNSNVIARDPRLRAEIVTKEGGTTLTEAAVARGLRWLAQHQNDDGSWSLNAFQKAGGCKCGGHGAFGKHPGTALALLPFLGAGQTHLAGKYRGNVARGLRWMVQHQREDGDLAGGSHGNDHMYTHGQATIVLCEAFAMTGDEELRMPAQKAVDFIVAAQYNDGGWRYHPKPVAQGDLSVVGWQVMALQSARAANLTVPDTTMGMANMFLDSVSHRDGARYAYMKRNDPTPTMTAEGLLCRLYLGWTKDRPGLHNGVEWLTRENNLPSASRPNIYYWYYATQTLHHYGGSEWETWNLKMRDVLTSTQRTDGHAAGSWDPAGPHSGEGGRIYMTSLAVCSLEVYYRHLPIFRQLQVDGSHGD